MNNTGYRWELLSGDINSRGLCEADVIRCPECHYTTNPQIVKWEYNGKTYGKATVPRICPKCHALMEVEHDDS